MQKSYGVLDRIRTIYPKLSKKEKTVADYILSYPHEIIHMSITSLADKCNISETTIFKLCRRLDLPGYQALKIRLASEVIHPLRTIHQEVTPEDDLILLTKKIFDENIQTLNDTLQSVVFHRESLRKAIELLVLANKIVFYGNGGSAAIAQDAYHKFLRIGILCEFHSDSHYQVMTSSLLQPDDVVVAVSHSGSNKDILDALKIAKKVGAKIIGITGYEKSPLVQIADVALLTISRETEFRTEALASRLAQLSLIDVLYVSVAIRLQDVTLRNLEKIREAISYKRL